MAAPDAGHPGDVADRPAVDRPPGPGPFVRIHSVPPGEAPLWVREQWVGLSLPLARRQAGPASILTSGVVTGPRTLLATLFALVAGRLDREIGFVVDARAALAALATRSPEALAWWQEHAPHAMEPRRTFVFHRSVGTVCDADPAA